ncbi:MAG: right-handed parallel beta-helix repeat-containing protein [bacterium]|nr:right-handed parallel beta-helix repeat-containing protein [bacterium]
MQKNIIFSVVILFLIFVAGSAFSTTTCQFTTSGDIVSLTGDCMTDETIFVPDGMTLDCGGNEIIGVDPMVGAFTGAVIQNGGTTAHVRQCIVSAVDLQNACKGGDDRLRGIMFEGASGSITQNVVGGINKGASGCQEGNAIEVRNAPFDGTHPNTQSVEVAHNQVTNWQKTGIVCNGDVDCDIHHNAVGASATQLNLAANGIQMGFGATGIIEHNYVEGNQWLGASDFGATAILLFSVDSVIVSQNNIRGNADVGIYGFTTNSLVDNNKVFDDDSVYSEFGELHGDYGIIDLGSGNVFSNNKVKGYADPYFGVEGGKNKSIPGPQKENVFF